MRKQWYRIYELCFLSILHFLTAFIAIVMQDLFGYYLFSSLSSRCIIPLVQGPCWTLVTSTSQGENHESRNSERKALLSVVLATRRGPQEAFSEVFWIQWESPKIARDSPRQPKPLSTPQSCHDTLLYLGIPNLWLETESGGCLPSWCGLDRLPMSSCLTCSQVWPRFHSPQRRIQFPRVKTGCHSRWHPGLQGHPHAWAVMMVSIWRCSGQQQTPESPSCLPYSSSPSFILGCNSPEIWKNIKKKMATNLAVGFITLYAVQCE